MLQHNDVSKFDAASGRGELKAANLSRTGKTNQKTSIFAARVPVRESFSAAKLAEDLLHGGAADNTPDKAFSAAALLRGKRHEREHTGNDQIAKEIAKDHLSEDPRYYQKVEQIEKASNVYGDQLMATPLAYNKDQSVWQNVLSHAGRVKARGDKQLEYQDSAERFRRAFVPGYREQAFLQSLKQPQIDAKKPFRERFDKFLEQALHKYGDKAINRLNFGEFNHMSHLG